MILFRPPSLPLSLLSRRAAIPRPGRLPHARFTSSTSQPSGKPPGLFRRTYYKDGKFNKHAFGVTVLILWGLGGCVNMYSLYWNKDDPRIVLASVTAKTLLYIDRQAFSQTDFSSFEQTMAYFRWCVLTSEWAMQHSGSIKMILIPAHRERLTMEDFQSFAPRINAKFDELLNMPEGQAKHHYHSKVKLACLDIHRFLQDFNSYNEEEIEQLLNKPVNEMTKEQRMVVAGIGLGTSTVVTVTWWSCPV